MKHIITYFMVLFACFQAFAQNTWVVCNTPGFDADFANLQTAINAASAGDVLLIQGSATGYGNATITKPLVLSGPGYFLNQNPETQAQMGEATLGILTIDNGASGTIIEGLTFVGGNAAGLIKLDSVSNVIIQSCRIANSLGCWQCEVYAISANYSQNIIVKNCYIYDNNTSFYGSNPWGQAIRGWGNGSSFMVSNSIILGGNISAAAISNSIFENNVVSCYNGHYDACSVRNNIFTSTSGFSTTTNSAFFNNLSAGAAFGSNTIGSQNQQNVDMSTVFVGWTTAANYSTDGRWQLKPNSPAIGAGVGGIDCGAWGGSSPYSLSGMSFNPNIWQVIMPINGTSGGGLNVTVKANANQ